MVGLFALLLVRRDLTAAYVVVAGVFTGIVAALISAPIAAGVFGGVTGVGHRLPGRRVPPGGRRTSRRRRTGQGLISDPIDKVTTFFTVYLILRRMANRFKARFPQGEHLVDRPRSQPPDRSREPGLERAPEALPGFLGRPARARSIA